MYLYIIQKQQNKNNHGKRTIYYRITVNHLGNRNNLVKEMKTQVITAKEYARLAGFSPESGIISRRLREYERTGNLIGMPGVINVKKHGYVWALEVLKSWVDGKELDHE